MRGMSLFSLQCYSLYDKTNYIYSMYLARQYFDDDVLLKVKDLQKRTMKILDPDTRQIAMVILASVIVRASKMTRQGDLRFAKANEKHECDRDIVSNFKQKIEDAISDIDSIDGTYPKFLWILPRVRLKNRVSTSINRNIHLFNRAGVRSLVDHQTTD